MYLIGDSNSIFFHIEIYNIPIKAMLINKTKILIVKLYFTKCLKIYHPDKK